MTTPRRRIYLDWNATAPLRPEAREALLRGLDIAGNPSSVHGFGREARRLLEDARARIAVRLGAAPERLVLTGGGSEANALALAQAARGPVLVSAIEHPSVLDAYHGAVKVPVSADGVVDLDALERLAAAHRPELVAVMLANNETGVVQPVRSVAEIAHRHGARLHVDAVQALGRIPVDMGELGADTLAVSAHKVGGPVGVGALVLTEGLEIRPLLRGGGQERGRRAGTENLAGALAFAAALDACTSGEATRLAALRDRMEGSLLRRVPGLRIPGAAAPRLPNTSCLALPAVDAATQLVRLDLEGVAVGAGSACSSGRIGRSHVLEAMGLEAAVRAGAIRVSLGWATLEEEIELFVERYVAMAEALATRADLVPAG